MKRSLASVLGAFGLSGVLLAGGVPGAMPTGVCVSDANSSTPSFSWTATISGVEFYDLTVQRFSGGVWITFLAASVAGDQTGHTFKGPGSGFREGLYRSALRARSTFWTGPWTTWATFTVTSTTTPRETAATVANADDIFPPFQNAEANPTGIRPNKSRVKSYNTARNPWARAIEQTSGAGYAGHSPATQTRRTVEMKPGVYRWDMHSRKSCTNDITRLKGSASPALDALHRPGLPPPGASPR